MAEEEEKAALDNGSGACLLRLAPLLSGRSVTRHLRRPHRATPSIRTIDASSPYGGRKPDAGGFMVPTEIKQSANPVAGRARYVLEDVKAGDPIRIQPIGSELLVKSRSAAEIEAHIANGTLDLTEVVHFGHTTSPTCELYQEAVFVNKPPLFCNHWSRREANMETEWTKGYK